MRAKTVYPIETAPRDGTKIVGVYDEADETVVEWVEGKWVQIGPGKWFWFGPSQGHWVQTSVGERVDEPPYWRPIERGDV